MKSDTEEIQRLFPAFDLLLSETIFRIGTRKTYHEGDVLMKKGQFIRSTLLILSGKVKLYRQSESGEEFFMYHIGAGEACALSMLCAIRNVASHVGAVVTEDTEAILIPIEEMDALMIQHKHWYHFVIETYRTRFEELLMVIDDIAFKNMDERLESYLRRHADSSSPNVYLTHQEIATDLNSSREVISRLLKKMEKKGMIVLQRHHIECKPILINPSVKKAMKGSI
jgi:CRP/FNR family transcriptional regulator